MMLFGTIRGQKVVIVRRRGKMNEHINAAHCVANGIEISQRSNNRLIHTR